MPAEVIDGRKMASEIRSSIRNGVNVFTKNSGRPPAIKMLMVGENTGSQIYARMINRGSNEVGMEFSAEELNGESSLKELSEAISALNKDEMVNGVLLASPMPPKIDYLAASEIICPIKDIDCVHSYNRANLLSGDVVIAPSTPHGIMTILERTGIELQGKEAVIINHSPVIGRPLALMMIRKNATVTVTHEFTKGLREHTKRADILVAAAGIPKMITSDMVKDGGVFIDVGMNKTEDGIVGDIDFDRVKELASYITPVPGGVGPMTVTMLLQNTLNLAQRQIDAGGSSK